jgi:DNA-binding XRE family transcriptional regulator
MAGLWSKESREAAAARAWAKWNDPVLDHPAAYSPLRQLRVEQEVTQRDLAQIVGLGRESIRRIEKGLRRPSIPTARRLAKALNTEIGVLWPTS